ncbi:MAG: YdcF family protein [Lachnospiraceae bacterium]
MKFGRKIAERDLEELERSLRGEGSSLRQRLGKLERSRGMQIFLWITMAVLLLYALFAFLYTTVIIYASGIGTSFLWFWPVTFLMALSAACGLFFVLIGKLPAAKPAAIALSILVWLLLLVVVFAELRIYSYGRKAPQEDADYVIILGAQVRGEVPSLVLSARIHAAAEYLLENPGAVAVASGGQGSGEAISEAEAIRRGLLQRGIAGERILLEDRSTSTVENLRFSAEVIAAREGAKAGEAAYQRKVVVVTNDFHVYRGVHLAEKMGYTQVSGLGAAEFYAVTIQYYVREFFAIILETLRGTL